MLCLSMSICPYAVKLLEELASLSKAYKQSCKRQGITAYSPFLQSISASVESVQPITKVYSTGAVLEI